MLGNVPYMFDCCADPVVHLLLHQLGICVSGSRGFIACLLITYFKRVNHRNAQNVFLNFFSPKRKYDFESKMPHELLN